ncbi:MAG: beta strand repeat-containing protein [Bacteroidota bacterium]
MSNVQYIVSKGLNAVWLLLIGIALSGNILFAAVTVTPATGGTNISADNAANASVPAWTTLGNIVITEVAKGDFATGTGVTLILTTPAGWEFNTGASVGTTVTGGAGGQNVSVTNVTLASTTITLTLTVSATNKTDILTITGVQVRSTEGGNLPASGNILRTAANPGTATITGITNNSTNFGSLSQVIGSMTRLVVTLPGQSFTDASTLAASGNSGTVTSQTAGVPFTITAIRATDQFFNVVTTYTGTKTLSYSGPGGISSTYTTSVDFTSGVSTTTLNTTLTRAQTTTITVTDGGQYGYASSNVTVNANTFTKMQILVPGETADAGSATGKSGTPNAQTAGSGFTVTVNAVDAYWNLVSSDNTVGITTSDANDTHPLNAGLGGGTMDFTVTFKTAGTSTVTATNISDGSKTANTSPSITVNPGAFTKLQILAPGESAAPGTVSGKTGSPSAQTAGTPFNVTVNAVDANWNLVNTVTDNISITSSDGNATLPGNNTLSSGTQTFSVTLRTAGSATVTATDNTDPLKTSNTTPSISVNAGAFTKLQILVPGESASPGSGTGKTGTPDVQTAGIPFNVTVNAVDADWNLVNTVTDVIAITSSDGGATLPSNAALVSGTGIRSVTFSTNGSFTVTASDVTDPGKTSDTSPSITVNPAGTGTVVPATGGEAISSDSVGGGYYTLTGPAYEEGQEGNISAGTIVLNAPPGFEFDDGGTAPTLLVTRTGGSGDDTRNINSIASGNSIAATSVTTSAITFTITNASNNGVTNSVTWQNVRVRPTTGYPLATGNLTVSGTASIAGVNGSTNFGTLTQVPGSIANLVVVLPGQDFVEGTGTTGTPSVQTAGSPFTIDSLVAVDQYFNIATSYSGVKTIAYAGPGGSSSSYTTAVSFTAGASTTVLTTTLTRAEVTTITATESGMYGYASSNLTVNAGTFTKMQLIVPGESVDAGSATGKTGTPGVQSAGTPFSVTVNAVDPYWNLVSGAPANSITLTTSDVNATMPAPANLSGGTVTFASVTLPTAGTATITATNSTDGSKTADTSPSITVNPGAINKLQALVPGEAAAPGTVSGKTGTPLNQASGSPFTITVNAVDANWNLVSSTDLVQITSSDGAATLPSNANLVGGTKDFTVTLNTAGAQTVTATDITNGSVTAGTSASITVAAVVITAATGGNAISADDFGTGSWTSLTGPAYDEATNGDVGTGTFIINAPSGFIFDIGGTAPTVLVTRISGGGGDSRNINSVASGTSVPITSITDSTVTFTITSASNSGVTNRLTWQNLRVRPTAGTPLASGNITKTGTSTMTGITNGVTNFGTLTEIHGAVKKLVITLPGETFTAGAGNSGSPDNQIENVPFNISSITAADQYFNIVLTYDSTGAAVAYSGPSGSPTYTTSVNFVDGISTSTLTTTLTAIENTSLTASMGDGFVFGPASSSFNVFGAPKTWDGGAATNNWNDANNWSPDGVPTSNHDVTLNGANTIDINVAAQTKNLTVSNAGLILTILGGNSLSVNGDLTQSAGTLNIETTFPTVSGTTDLTGGTVVYTASGAQNISAQTYYHLATGGSGTKTAAGVITIDGDLSIIAGTTLNDGGYQIVGNATGSVTMAGGSTLSLGSGSTATAFPSGYVFGNIALNSSSTVIYSSDQPQNIDALNFGNLSGGGTGARTFPAFQTVGVSGTFTPGTNSYTITSSTIDFNGTSAQSIPAFTYNNLTVTSASAVTKTLGGAITVNDDLTINTNNTLDDAGYQITGNASGTLTIAAGALLSIGNASTATAFPTNYINSNISLHASSTVVYNSDQAQTISLVPTYGNLTLTSAAPVTKTINGTATVQTTVTINVNNILSISGSGILNINNGNLELFGDISNSGTINIGL